MQAEMENLKAELAKLRADLSGVAQALKSTGAAEAAELKASIKEALAHAYEEVRDKGKKSVEAVEHQVTEHPIIAILAAFGAGFLVAKLLDRK